MPQVPYELRKKVDSTDTSLGVQKFFHPDLHFPGEQRMRDLVISHLKGGCILDAGCGNGWLSICALERGFGVYAVDVARNELRKSAFISKRRKAPIKLALASLGHLPFLDSSFDSVMCVNVLEHIRDVEKTILEIKRVLKKDGRFVLVIPNGLTFGLLYDKFVYRLIPAKAILSHVHKRTFSLSKNEISQLKLEESEPIGHCQQFTLPGVCSLLTREGFRIVRIANCRFLSPYVRSFSTLLGTGPIKSFEMLDTRVADHVPSNLAAEWMIACEK